MELNICHLYPDILNLYGDRGNIIVHTDYVRTWNEERDYLWPIPADQRVLTGGLLTQNPGWTDSTDFD